MIGIKKLGRCLVVHNHSDFPTEVVGVAQAAIKALSPEGGHHVGGIAEQEDSAMIESFCQC